jgi:hypothetical protein
MDNYYEARFENQVNAALKRVKAVLDTTRNPVLPGSVPHTYEDKYALAETAIKTALACQMNSLQSIGLDDEKLACLLEWCRAKRVVTLHFSVEESCTFDRTTERDQESATSHVVEAKSSFLGNSKVTSKTVTKITEHFWRYEAEWTIKAYAGGQSTAESKPLVLQSRKGSCELKTTGITKTSPRPPVTNHAGIELNFDFALRCFDSEGKIKFDIDRGAQDTHTPRRNKNTAEALTYFEDMYRWLRQVKSQIDRSFFRPDPSFRQKEAGLKSSEKFSPVHAMFSFENQEEGEAGVALSEADLHCFLAEYKTQIEQRQEVAATIFAGADDSTTLATTAEWSLVEAATSCSEVCQHASDALDAIEAMLYKQLQSAIGKEIGPADFTEYMTFHNRRLFNEQYRPKGFCFAVRRPDHHPEGTLAIEFGSGATKGSDAQQLTTLVSRSEAVAPMRFALNAATDVSFTGERLLHASVLHTFSGAAPAPLQLQARARQFSSYILVVGKIAAADVFEPTGAIIVKDKDDLKIPLMLETIPTPKEFRDAIESMSPEQQRFCKAFRGMQLASTLFGVLVIQIKPQLERLLNLPGDALTKEIRLTQDLMTLFIEHQIPSDLISYGGDSSASPGEKLAAVKEHVAAVNLLIEQEKEAELKEAELKKQKAAAEMEASWARQQQQQQIPSFGGGELCELSASQSLEKAASFSFGGGGRGGGGGKGGMQKKMSRSRGAAMGGATMQRSMAAPSMAAPQMMERSCAAPAPPGAPMAPPAPPPSAASATVSKGAKIAQPQQPAQQQKPSSGAGAGAVAVDTIDYTAIPGELDRQYEALDEDSALRPTTITTGPRWQLSSQAGLLSKPTTTSLHANEQAEKKAEAFDLLDALSRSGELQIEHASLHVVIAATHCFDKSLVDTVILGNTNPIEKVERSMLIVAGVIHRAETAAMIQDSQVSRIAEFAPKLLEGATIEIA